MKELKHFFIGILAFFFFPLVAIGIIIYGIGSIFITLGKEISKDIKSL